MIKSTILKNDAYIIAGLFGFIFGVLVVTFYTPNYFKNKTDVYFVVKKGQALNSVIDTLYSLGAIPNKTNMKIAAWITGTSENLKAGQYKIHSGISYTKLCEILSTGMPPPQKLVTIQEGIWQEKLAELLAEKVGINANRFLKLSKDKYFIRKLGLRVKNIEGYLLPDTYYFYEGSTESEIISRLVGEMQNFFSNHEIQKQMKKLKMNENQILTLASIIDGESNKVEEFKRISGVYYNRLKRGMLLQADPTIQYIVRHRRRKVNKIYYKDLEIDSPYNTYKYRGLPPSPINNPGKDAILAALYPEKHKYLYFVANGKGGHIFSKTSAEHLRNVRRYRAWRNSNR